MPDDSPTVDEQLFDAARTGDANRLAVLLDKYPDKLQGRAEPYGWTLLHLAARHLGAVDLLLKRGLDVNAREKGDNTHAMHWAAAAGQLDVVRRLADAGGDVVGDGDDHQLAVIGWATCWDGCDDAAHRAVAEFLVSHGARHHIFSAIAMDLADEVRRIVVSDPSALHRRMSRNEAHQLPLHFAVRMKRPAMVALLMALGADPLGVDSAGFPASTYATTTDIDRPIMEAIRSMTSAELVSADRGQRRPSVTSMDVVAVLSLHDWETAGTLIGADPASTGAGDVPAGALHLMAKRNDPSAVKWLLEHGADPNARWAHWNAEVTPLHLAAMQGHADVVRLLLDAGADPSVRDSAHDSDPLGWAEFFQRPEVVRILKDRAAREEDSAGALPDTLLQTVRAFQESRVILTAIELDVFSAVSAGTGTAQDVATRIGAAARANEMLLNALVAIRLLDKRGDRYTNTATAARHLAAGGADDSRAALMHTVHLWTTWSRLTDAVRAGTATDRAEEGGDRSETWTEAFIAAMHKNAQGRAGAVVRAAGVEGARTMLDVGGGSGAYSIAFARTLPQLRVDLLDLPDVTRIAQRHIAAAHLEDRIRTRAGDLRTDAFGEGYDIILVSAICHMLSPEENRDLLKRCFAAAAPGGRVIVQDFILDASKTAPKAGALFALNMLVGTRSGSSYSEQEYTEWLRAAGSTWIEHVRLPGPTGLMIGVRP